MSTLAFINGNDSDWSVVVYSSKNNKTELAISFYPALNEFYLTEAGSNCLLIGTIKDETVNSKLNEVELSSLISSISWRRVVLEEKQALKPEQLRIASYINSNRFSSQPDLINTLFEMCGLVATPISGAGVVRGFVNDLYDGWVVHDMAEWDWRPVCYQLEAFGARTAIMADRVFIAAKNQRELAFLKQIVNSSI